MNRKINIFLLLLLIPWTIIQGCSDIKIGTGDIIVPPQNQKIAIEGTWKVTYDKFLGNKSLWKEKETPYYGKTAMFGENFVVFGDEVYLDPKYKMKKVNSRNFFHYVHKISHRDLGMIGNNVEVISITSKDKHIYDFIRVNDKRLIVFIDHIFYYLDKVSENMEENIPMEVANKQPIPQVFIKEEDSLRSGILIGLRSPIRTRSSYETPPQDPEVYRTIWIASKNRIIYPLLEAPHIFLPRKSGFWMVGMERRINHGIIRDSLFAYPIKSTLDSIKLINGKNAKLENHMDKAVDFMNSDYVKELEVNKENLEKSILFIGNDYVAIEYSKYMLPQEANPKELKVLPIDNIEQDIGVNISDLIDGNGKEAITNSAQAYLTTISESEAHLLTKEIREDSFALIRRNGHWIMKGRLYYLKPFYNNYHIDYNINLIPPEKIVNYDDLSLTWNQIKTRVPDALDAYTSPNKDLAIIMTKNCIYVYTIKDDELSNRYVSRIQLKEGESAIMAEWATGSYVEKWNNLFDDTATVIQE